MKHLTHSDACREVSQLHWLRVLCWLAGWRGLVERRVEQGELELRREGHHAAGAGRGEEHA